MSQTNERPNIAKERVESLQADASRVLREISDLSAKLRDVSKEKMAEVSDETVSLLKQSLADLEERAASLNIEGRKLLGELDKKVRANPYMFILGALGLGVLLGKWVGSQDRRQ
jgi:ElaB/YqjD/DUF883 family membrane-anchored ribosome-binding protein